MKKVLAVALVILLMGSLLMGCGGDGGSTTPDTATTDDSDAGDGDIGIDATNPSVDGGAAGGANEAELALIVGQGSLDDRSFNQNSYEGITRYAEENDISYTYFQSTAASDQAYLDAIDLAVRGGAKIVVLPGFYFDVAVYQAQDTYPDVNFILIDGAVNDGAGDFRTEDNAVGITFAEQEAGFLAGYAVVMDGYRQLGFMGGMALPAVVRFGYGYIQGAEYAAEESGLASGDVTMNYNYIGNFDPSPDVQATASSWYNAGTEVIFACAGGAGNSVMAAAEAADGKVVGVDVDQSGESPTVITSAMKMLANAVYDTISDFYDGNFPGGQDLVFTAANDGVGLPMETSQFETFTEADYEAIFAQIKDGSIEIMSDTDNGEDVEVSDLPTSIVTVTEVN